MVDIRGQLVGVDSLFPDSVDQTQVFRLGDKCYPLNHLIDSGLCVDTTSQLLGDSGKSTARTRREKRIKSAIGAVKGTQILDVAWNWTRISWCLEVRHLR